MTNTSLDYRTRIVKICIIIMILLLSVLAGMCIIDAVTSEKLAYSLPFVKYGGCFKFSSVKLFGLGGVSLYVLSYILGVLMMILVSVYLREKLGISIIQAIAYPIALAIIGYAGAKVLYYIESPSRIKANFTFGGLSFYGAVFFYPLFGLITAQLLKKKLGDTLDFGVVLGLIMLLCARLGCFTAGCCSSRIIWVNTTNPLILPTPLFEAILDLILLYALLTLQQKKYLIRYHYFVFLCGYGLIRFVCEFMRDSPELILSVSKGKFYSLIALIIGVIFLFIAFRRKSSQQIADSSLVNSDVIK